MGTAEAPEMIMSEDIGVNLIVENVLTIDLSPIKPAVVDLMENSSGYVEPEVVVPDVTVSAPTSFPVHASSGLARSQAAAKRDAVRRSGSAAAAKSGSATAGKPGSATTGKSGSASMKPGSVRVTPRASSKTGLKSSAKSQAKSKAGRK